MTTESNTRAYLTTRQACDRLGYSRPGSLLQGAPPGRVGTWCSGILCLDTGP
jgi:hypothetical protein